MTLTEASFWTKRFGIVAAVGLVIILGIIIVLLSIEPPKPAEYLNPNYACTEKGTEFLEKAKITIPTLVIDPDSIAKFEVATDTGKINALPSVINVYKFENPTQAWVAQANATILAGILGFDQEKIIIEDTATYKWKDMINKRTLVVDAKNLNFVLETDAARIRQIGGKGSVPNENSAKSTALNVLNSTGRINFKDEFLTKNMTVTYINIKPDGSYGKAPSQSDAELVRVDFFRERSMITLSTKLTGVDNMVKEFTNITDREPTKTKRTINDKVIEFYTFDTRVVLPRSKDSNISVWIGAQDKSSKLGSGLSSTYRIEYTYWPSSYDACGTYPLIPTTTALDEVMKGNGSIAYLYEKGGDYVTGYTQKNVKNFRITNNIRIMYYESTEELNFLLPVYLISGEAVFADDSKGEFDIYYPAIDYNNIKDKVVIKEIPVEDKGDSFF